MTETRATPIRTAPDLAALEADLAKNEGQPTREPFGAKAIPIEKVGALSADAMSQAFERAAVDVENGVLPVRELLRQLEEDAAALAGWLRQEGQRHGQALADATKHAEELAVKYRTDRKKIGNGSGGD